MKVFFYELAPKIYKEFIIDENNIFITGLSIGDMVHYAILFFILDILIRQVQQVE